MNYGYIYITTNLINGKKYIGQHKSEKFDESYKGSGKTLVKAFEKYGFENFTTEILEWCEDQDTLNEKEIYYIALYDAVNSEDFYNLSKGGYSAPVLTEESHKKQSETLKKHYADGTVIPFNKGKTLNEETKLNISIKTKESMNKPEIKNKLKGNKNPRTEEEKLAIKLRFKGVPKSKEHKEKIRLALTGVPFTEDRKNNISKALKASNKNKGANNFNAKKVMCVETGEIFGYSAEAAIAYNCNAKSIKCCCNGKYKTSGGYH